MKINSKWLPGALSAWVVAAGASLGPGAWAAEGQRLAATPPMGWNDWAHYQCDYTAKTIVANARALVRSGLAARGYDTVTIDDCWMLPKRNTRGDLQADPGRFPGGIRPVAAAIHALGLKFGIYEDAGSQTCGGFAGSGAAASGGEAHFLADARLFASWGVDYLKLDGCNVQQAPGQSLNAAYRAAYRAEREALDRAGRPVVFSESAPAYFQATPAWYDVLGWVGGYGQLWREGTDVAIYDRTRPNRSRFRSVMWNYDYNLQLGRFQKPGNWDDADFIIGGDHGMTLAESRSQLALWSMMSAPLILSSNLERLSPAVLGILRNKAVLAVDQDPLGRMATLLRRSLAMDLLLKPLKHGAYAVAVLNRSASVLRLRISPRELGFTGRGCRFDARDLWSGVRDASTGELRAAIDAHDTAIWKIRPKAACGAPARVGAITRIVPDLTRSQRDAADYTLCLAAPGGVEQCAGTPAERWRITPNGALVSAGECLTGKGGAAVLAPCRISADQQWRYTLSGNLINRASRLCLTGARKGGLAAAACGHNLASQIWTLPNGAIQR